MRDVIAHLPTTTATPGDNVVNETQRGAESNIGRVVELFGTPPTHAARHVGVSNIHEHLQVTAYICEFYFNRCRKVNKIVYYYTRRFAGRK